jgi:hypothetical protein
MFEEPANLVDRTFRDLLNQAITGGRRPRRTAILGPATWAAIDVLAHEHPDATAHHLAAAYDAFQSEHRNTADCEPPTSEDPEDPLTARAAEFAAIDALIAQLKISYPEVDPDTVATVVRQVHARFDGRPIRDFVPLFVERAAHKKLA